MRKTVTMTGREEQPGHAGTKTTTTRIRMVKLVTANVTANVTEIARGIVTEIATVIEIATEIATETVIVTRTVIVIVIATAITINVEDLVETTTTTHTTSLEALGNWTTTTIIITDLSENVIAKGSREICRRTAVYHQHQVHQA
jgi:hypothetical protein